MSPAMAVGALDRLVTIEAFHDVITEAARTPPDKPEKKPLVHLRPESTSRGLPGGRGFLRVVQGGGAPSPSPTPATPPVAPVAVSASTTAALRLDVNGQADLFSWTPSKREPQQLSLFGDPPEAR